MYAMVRNPMALSAVLQSFGVGLWFGSWPVLGYSISAGLVWHVLLRSSEEQFLHANSVKRMTTTGLEFASKFTWSAAGVSGKLSQRT
jgi:hypothetical protein